MSGLDPDDPGAIERVIEAAGVGADDLFADLVTMGAIGEVRVDRAANAATVPVTLPIPAAGIRTALAETIEQEVSEIRGIDTVAVEWTPAVPQFPGSVDFLPAVKNVIAVASGKGGVGKSTVAANLAASLAETGVDVGLLDADIYGPNAPKLLGARSIRPDTTPDDRMIPPVVNGVSLMSMDFIVEESDPVIWRGVLVDEMIQQLFVDVAWGELDYLIVDLPPGTGDAQLSLVQHVPVTGAVLVTTPQGVAVEDTQRSLEAFVNNNVAILGIVENMHEFVCPDCDGRHRIFDADGAEQLASAVDVPVLGTVPLDPAVGAVADATAGTSPGVSIPLVGRIGLPRTAEERDGDVPLPPIVHRTDDRSETAAALRTVASRTAARMNHLVRGDVVDHVH